MSTPIKSLKTTLKRIPFVWQMVCVLVMLRLPWLFFALIERDEGVFGYVGWVLATGGTPYLDVVDHHGLSLYTLYALSYHLFGVGVIPLRIVVLILQILTLLALYNLALRWFDKRTANLTALFFALFSNIPVFESHYAMTEPLSTPFAVFGLWVYEHWRDKKRTSWYLLAWLLVAFASSIRFTQAFFGVMLATVITLDTLLDTAIPFPQRVKTLFWRGFLALCMVILVWGTIALVLWSKGGLGAFTQILGETLLYGTVSNYIPLPMRLFILQQGIVLFALVALSLLYLLWHYRRLKRAHFVVLWWVVVFTWVVTRPQMLGHYFVQIVPVAAIFASFGYIGLAEFFGWLTRRKQWGRIGATIIVGLLIASAVPSMIYQFPDMHPPIQGGRDTFNYADSLTYSDQLQLAAEIKALMLQVREYNPDAHLYVFGNAPAIYWLSEERAPVRDTYAINYYSWVVHEHGDPHPFQQVRADNTEVVVLFDLYIGQSLIDVTYYVQTYYEQVARIGSATLWQRKRLQLVD